MAVSFTWIWMQSNGILLSAILFSIFPASADLACRQELVFRLRSINVSIALIIFFVGINFLIRFVMAKFFQGKNKKKSLRQSKRSQRIKTMKEANYNVDYRINCLDSYFNTGLFNTVNSNITRRNVF